MLSVEVDRDSEVLAARLVSMGYEAVIEGRFVAVQVGAEAEADNQRLTSIVVGVVAELGLPLVSLTRKRASLTDIFRGPQ